MIQLAVLSSRQLMRNLIRHSLMSLDDRFHALAELAISENAMGRCMDLRPDLVIFDLSDHNPSDFVILREFSGPGTKWGLVVIVSELHVSLFHALVRRRGSGILSADTSLEALVHVACLVAGGGTYIDSPFVPLMEEFTTKPISGDLSLRERDVLKLIAEGYSTKEVAQILNLSVKTIDQYRGMVMKKLRVHDVVRLTHAAIRLGIIKI
jgi:DNA-binding NarL/FixJ family response regulator